MWEILVPTRRANGRPYHTRHHRVWDTKVRAVAGGLTIMRPAKGQWVSPSGALFIERMIPVRISCSREEIHRIIALTFDHYPDQQAVMAYEVSRCVIIAKRPEGKAVYCFKETA